jgi:hypothetical protein
MNAHERKNFQILTVPFQQLANMSVFADINQLETYFYGCREGRLKWISFSNNAEWPGEFPRYLKGTGVILEPLTEDVVTVLPDRFGRRNLALGLQKFQS